MVSSNCLAINSKHLRHRFAYIENRPVIEEYSSLADGYAEAEGAREGEVVGLSEYDWLLALHNKVESVRERYTEAERKCPKVCRIPFERIFVDIEGTCQVCCQSWYPVGNLRKQSLAEIWNGERLNSFRERMKKGNYNDCGITCIHNPSPSKPRVALMRKIAFKATRDPLLYLKKARTKRKMQNHFRKLKEERLLS